MPRSRDSSASTGEPPRDSCRTVLLLADPGIGKTRLAREFLARRRGRAIALSARAYPLGETASFGLWSEALESHLRGLGPEEVTRLCGGCGISMASSFIRCRPNASTAFTGRVALGVDPIG